jgi:hypothetical protein
MKVFLSGLIRLIYKNFRRTLYRILSDNKPIIDKCVRLQPVITAGEGKINLHKCVLGYYPSEKFWSGYCHIEARSHSSEIVISDNVFLNNDAVLVAERSSIIIEADCLIELEFMIQTFITWIPENGLMEPINVHQFI